MAPAASAGPTGSPSVARASCSATTADGTYAELFKIQEDSLLPLPPEIGFEEGAILSCAIGTVIAAIRDVGRRAAPRVRPQSLRAPRGMRGRWALELQ